MVSAMFGFMNNLFRKKREEMIAIQTREYDNIRSTIHLCIYSGSLLIIEMRINAFKSYSENILPREMHIKMCDELDRVFAEKYKEVLEMELMMDNTLMIVSN
jgi:hypothetical protein